ncbi:phenol hydroxylase P2 protein [Oceanisphaera litoralis]|uniref:MmoB/DmpM family protein n=1 Tax=Oceanisphaera litoralis TaxID=225144 RepID=UPI00195A3B46|nr:MmoB/DmpM family protein [Oceanisphaera litoralis]MBM7456768.1 phenol hydroxylase P2 protein [Oceanisphaera litoralis]
MSNNVFIAFQANDDTRPIIEAIEQDNPHASIQYLPAMVKIDAPDQLVIRRESVEEMLGRSWDLQEIQINLISISGNIDETEDSFTVGWFR